jgi:hypothetical protein
MKDQKTANGLVEPVYEVVWPLGRAVSQPVNLAPPVTDLNGKTVGELWDWVFKGDKMFPIIREELRNKYPDIKFVEFSSLGNTHGSNERDYVAALPDLLRQHGCDAVISAVGA